MVGMIYERCHTRDLAAYGGLAKILPLYALFFTILTLASVGLPTTSGFTGEFLALLGYFVAAWPQYGRGDAFPLTLAVVAVSGVVLGALYSWARAAPALRPGQRAAPALRRLNGASAQSSRASWSRSSPSALPRRAYGQTARSRAFQKHVTARKRRDTSLSLEGKPRTGHIPSPAALARALVAS